MKTVLVSLMAATTLPLFAQKDASIRIYPEQGNQQISKHIYGQFAEHLGTCIYGGLWVGPESEIPNTQGYRNDVLNALKELKIPNLRWPGGCFADEYHWMDGIGPKENRPKMVNNNWGGTIEDNSFGTHEFLNLCELLGCEPYISANVGSGTVEEMAKWVEYMTSEGDSPMARLQPAKRTRQGMESQIHRCRQRKLGMWRKHAPRILRRPLPPLLHLLPQLRRATAFSRLPAEPATTTTTGRRR